MRLLPGAESGVSTSEKEGDRQAPAKSEKEEEGRDGEVEYGIKSGVIGEPG